MKSHKNFKQSPLNIQEPNAESDSFTNQTSNHRQSFKKIMSHYIDIFLLYKIAVIWWFTFLGVIILESGLGIIIGLCTVLLIKIIEWIHSRLSLYVV